MEIGHFSAIIQHDECWEIDSKSSLEIDDFHKARYHRISQSRDAVCDMNWLEKEVQICGSVDSSFRGSERIVRAVSQGILHVLDDDLYNAVFPESLKGLRQDAAGHLYSI
jgi:hypothetical protein